MAFELKVESKFVNRTFNDYISCSYHANTQSISRSYDGFA